ncbi:MAG: metal ABC transporter ATP-binding protein [bacterium]
MVDPALLLELRDVSVWRDGHALVAGASLEVMRGSVHVLAGPNGAGKSTLLAAMLGMVPFDGSIQFQWSGAGRIGFVPQRFHVDRTLPLSVGEFLAIQRQRRPVCLGLSRAVRGRLDTLLAGVGLDGFARRALSSLSGGELQRVLLANAIDPVPELLLLDEPASGLDEQAADWFETAVQELRRRGGVTVLMVSHDLGQARRIADHVTVLDRTVRRSGAPSAVLRDGSDGVPDGRIGAS